MMKNKATHILTKIAVNIGRLLMAITFILSGFVKGIDPLGTQYKITDYLEALHIDWMFPSWSTLVMSVLLATAEFAIGIFLLFAIRRRLMSKITLAVMSVMTLITLWIVIADPVKDCGCFGDAVVLTNMETFIKNIILLDIRRPALEESRWRCQRLISKPDPVGGDQLHLPLLHRDEHLESVVSSAIRLPPLSYRCQHRQGHGDSEGSQATQV